MEINDMTPAQARIWLAYLQAFVPQPDFVTVPYTRKGDERLRDIADVKARIAADGARSDEFDPNTVYVDSEGGQVWIQGDDGLWRYICDATGVMSCDSAEIPPAWAGPYVALDPDVARLVRAGIAARIERF